MIYVSILIICVVHVSDFSRKELQLKGRFARWSNDLAVRLGGFLH